MKKIISILFVCVVAVTAMALPARRDGFVRTAADGTQKTVYLHGDAFFHYMTDAEGTWLDEETLMPMSAEEKAFRLESGTQRVQARRVQKAQKVGGDLNLAPRGLLILVNFKDKAFVTPKDTMNNMLNGENFTRSYSYRASGSRTKTHITANGSARRYFQDQSWGQYNPVFDVVGPVTISQNMAYYGGNNRSGDDKAPGKMIKEACELANSQLGVDFTVYDNNNDGKVDFVYVIYAGYGEADGGGDDTVWPHNWDLASTGESCTVDGKKIRNYACSNEMQVNDNYAGIGTFCHEFSHVLGFPDLYGNASHTLCDWDIMDYGPYNNDGNTPPAYSAYERFYMGWLTPRVLKDPEAIWLGQLNADRTALLMCDGDSHNLIGNDPNPTVFYILENRKKDGWDKYLPGNGLLITKVQYSANKWWGNTVNDVESAMGVDIIEAKGNTSDLGRKTDAFPAGAQEYTGFADHEITQIELEPNDAITFSYRGAAKTAIEDVKATESAQKILRDGQVLIIRNGIIYDLHGRMITTL